jgi:curved DNA-binding protein CbpA
MTHRNHYEVLGVARTATPDEIRRAYRRLAHTYHPDVSSAVDARDRFDEVSTAYDVLHDPGRRARYDRLSGGVAWRPARDVPRFLDDDVEPVHGLRFEMVWDWPRPPQLGFQLFGLFGGEWAGVRWWPW